MDSIKAISFDLDDTLWAIDPVIKRSEEKIQKYILKTFPLIKSGNIQNDFSEALKDVRKSYPQLSYNLTELSRLSFEGLLKKYDYEPDQSYDLVQRYLDFRHEVEIYPDVFECLGILSKRFKIASLTNGNADVMRLSIGKYFFAHVCAEEVGVKKPDKMMFSRLSEVLDTPQEFILHVGDHPIEDVIAAKESGLQSVWMNRFKKEWPLQEKVPHEVTNLNQLTDLL